MAKNMYQKRKERQLKINEKNDDKGGLQKTDINWYPGHMAKTKRLIKENIKLIDIIYEVIDSRIPYSSKIVDLDDLVLDKPRILIMTKYDLCDKSVTDKFISYYESIGYSVLKYDLTTSPVNEIFELSNKILKTKLDSLRDKGMKRTSIRALVVGIPNVGKSTLINKIVGKKIANVGNKPGVTKSLSWIRAYKNIELMDSPGILWPKLDGDKLAHNLASTTAIKEDILPKEDVVVYIIKFLYKYYPQLLFSSYGVDNIEDFYEVFETIGKKKSLIGRGGIVDDDRVVNLVLNDVKSGKLKDITFDRIEDYDL